MLRNLTLALCVAAFTQAISPAQVVAQFPPQFVGLGDSIGEGVQSADGNERTQPNTYLNLIAQQMGVPFALPLIQSGPLGVVGSTLERSRVDLSVMTPNLAVSGATTGSILTDMPSSPITSEVSLVLTPYTGTQITIAQQLKGPLTVCWIGSNDALGAILSFNDLNGTQLTSQSQFLANFQQIVAGLTTWGGKVMFINVPDATLVGFMMNNQDLITFLGNDYGLPDGSLTSAIAMLLVKLGINDGSIISDPNWVLDPSEIQNIENAVTGYNQTIAQITSQAGVGLVDAYTLFNDVVSNPPVFGNVTLTNRLNGGLFSLDGVHPSNIGHALVANYVMDATNAFYNMSIPVIGEKDLATITKDDPFVAVTGGLVVRGRPYAGLLETLGPHLGLSGDKTEAPMRPGVDKSLGPKFMRAYFQATGQDPNRSWTQDDAIRALAHIFGIEQYMR
jgi:lysophospholipase L1-like esterase